MNLMIFFRESDEILEKDGEEKEGEKPAAVDAAKKDTGYKKPVWMKQPKKSSSNKKTKKPQTKQQQQKDIKNAAAAAAAKVPAKTTAATPPNGVKKVPKPPAEDKAGMYIFRLLPLFLYK